MAKARMKTSRSWPVVSLLAAISLLPPSLSAKAEFSGDVAFVSRQVVRGIGRAGASVQPDVELATGGLRAGVWTNQPFDRAQVRETNLNAAYAWQPVEELALEFSAGQSWYEQVPGGGVSRSLECGLTATLPGIRGFAPSVAYSHDFTCDADAVRASFARSIALTKLGAFLECNFFAGAVAGNDWRPDAPGPRRHDGYCYWGAEARVPYRVGARTIVTGGIHYAGTAGRSRTGGPFGLSAASNLWFSLGVNLDF